MTLKNHLTVLLFLLSTMGVFAQDDMPAELLEKLPDSVRARVERGEEIFTPVEISAEPVGGMVSFYQYVAKKIKYPKSVRRGNIKGRVFVEFIVEKDGSINQESVRCIMPDEMPEITGNPVVLDDPACQQETMRLIKEAPNWTPGKQRGNPVKQRIVLPITFQK